MAAPLPLQKGYIIVVNNVVFIYIYICNIYGHTIFLCHLWRFFICILFDVIVFNMLKVIRVFGSVSCVCSFPVAHAASWACRPGRRAMCAAAAFAHVLQLCLHVLRVKSSLDRTPFLGLSVTNGSQVFPAIRCISVSFK